MAITEADLWVINANQTDREKLNKVLDYIQTAMPVNGAPSVAEFAQLRDVRIEINNVGRQEYAIENGERIIRWDPAYGLELQDQDGNFIGVNSAALVLLHEINHAIDPNFLENYNSPNALWQNDAERYAAQRTNSAAMEAGEAIREKYAGDPLVPAPDPTERTMHFDQFEQFNFVSSADQVWVMEDDIISDAFSVFGDVFEMSDLLYGMPSIGGGGAGPLWPEDDPDGGVIQPDMATASAEPVQLVGQVQMHDHAMFV